MSDRPVVTLIYEVNCYEDRRTWAERRRDAAILRLRGSVGMPGWGTVWVMAGTLGENDEYAEVARKVVGPLPADQADVAVAVLRASLEAAGVRVLTETTADD